MKYNGIGRRAYEECLKIFGSVYEAVDKIEASAPIIVYRWRDDYSPSAFYLAKLYDAGADVGYILTGKKGLER